jgi:hypothetical protein
MIDNGMAVNMIKVLRPFLKNKNSIRIAKSALRRSSFGIVKGLHDKGRLVHNNFHIQVDPQFLFDLLHLLTDASQAVTVLASLCFMIWMQPHFLHRLW